MSGKSRISVVMSSFFSVILMASLTLPKLAPAQSYPGWGAQAWSQEAMPNLPYDPAYWTGFVAEAFQYAPKGSFLEVSEEYVAMKFTATIRARDNIVNHQIPIDSAAFTRVFLDGQMVFETPMNSHSIVTLSFSRGIHVVDVIVEGGVNWTLVSIGDCLWGTDPRIIFLEAGQ